MSNERLYISVLCLVAALVFCSILQAGEHCGVVRLGDQPVPGATVAAIQGEKRFAAVTDQVGSYCFADLADGVWTIRVEMLGFAPAEREIPVSSTQAVAEWPMKLLPYAEIQALAPAAVPPASQPPVKPEQQPAVSAKDTRRARTAPMPQVANTPSAFQRAELKASPDTAKLDAGDGPSAPGEFSPAPSDDFLINGSVNNGAASPFAQAAAFGNYRLKRSLYSGSLGSIFDSSFWNARAFSLTGQNTPKPAYTRAQGLLSLGGPLNIPGLFPRNGPNVTFNYQRTRNRNATTNTALVPTLAERRGDFSQMLNMQGRPVIVIDPDAGLPFAENAIPETRISPQAKALLGLYPAPNFTAGTRYNFQLPLVGSTHQDSVQSRFNKTISRNNALSGQFAVQSVRTDSTSLFGFLDTGSSTGINTSLNWNRRMTPRTFFTVGYLFSRMSNRMKPYFAGRQNVSGMAGVTGNNQEPANWGPPGLIFSSGITGLSEAQNSLARNQTSSVSGSVYWARGSHNLIIGADFRRQQFNLLSQQDPRGTFTFTGAAAGSDFAGFLLGIPDASSIAFGNADKYFRASSYDGYFTDDWRIKASFTINGGLRWEYNAPIAERYGRLVNLDTAPGFAAVAPVVAAQPAGSLSGLNYPDSLIQPYRRAVQPRIGVSWRPFAASSIIVRAGYGVYYDSSIYLPIATRMAQQSPLSKSLSVENSAENPLTLANGFNALPNGLANTFGVDPSFRPGYAQNWQISIQRDLPGALVATATYLGIKGTRAQQQFLPNTYPAGSVKSCPACSTGYIYLTSNGNSTRESGQIQLRRRMRSGFTAQLSYTLSKSIDNAATGGAGQNAAVIAQDWLNLSGERGLSSFDQRHLLSLQVQYTTGMGLAGGTLLGGWRGGLFKDWSLATQITGGSGLPLTPIYMSTVRGTGVTGSIRPDYTGASLYSAMSGLFLNPAAVAAPASGRWGNAGRNSITGPSQFALNASLARTFRLSDRFSADFRLDSVNAMNHVTFPSWNTVATSAQFGLPVTANPMRSLQATMRVRF